jgi:hypothetical protein
MTNIVNRTLGNLQPAGRLNPMKKFESHRASSVTGRLKAPETWKHIDTKFGLSHHDAETHRHALSMGYGGYVRKLLANFKLKEWHFHLKVR